MAIVIPMLRRPLTRYAVFDGTHIGYQVVGSGELDVVLMHQWFTNIEALWDVPLLASFVEEVSAFARVLLFDKRGASSSTSVRGWPVPPAQVRCSYPEQWPTYSSART